MKGCRYTLEVERFVMFGGSADVAARLELDASIVSGAAILDVRLVSPGFVLPLAVDPQADDDDPRLLLSLRASVADAAGPFEQAELQIDAANGDRLAFGVGHLFRPPGWMPAVAALAGERALALLVPGADALAEALAAGFAALDDPADLLMHRREGAWVATSHRYGLHFPTPVDGGLERAEAREQAGDLARALAAGLLDTLDHGMPLLVHQGTPTDTDDTMASLFAALRVRNRDAALLWLDPHRGRGPVIRYRVGAVEPPQAGLLVAAAGTDWDSMLGCARDLLVAPR